MNQAIVCGVLAGIVSVWSGQFVQRLLLRYSFGERGVTYIHTHTAPKTHIYCPRIQCAVSVEMHNARCTMHMNTFWTVEQRRRQEDANISASIGSIDTNAKLSIMALGLIGKDQFSLKRCERMVHPCPTISIRDIPLCVAIAQNGINTNMCRMSEGFRG